MAVRLNEDKETVRIIKEGLKQKGGYCPCRMERTEDSKCICREFREQMEDPDFEGYCHCLLYYKSKDMFKVTKDNFNDEVMKARVPVLIDFYADWCGPCCMLSPTLEELDKEREDINVCKVNVDNDPELAAAFEISVIPTLVAMKDGGVIGKTTGVIGKKSILGLLKID